MKRLLRILDFVRLLDETGALSLTNIAVIIILVKLAVNDVPSYADLGALLTVLSTYTVKRYNQRRQRYSREPVIDVVSNLDKVKLDSLYNDVERLKLASGFRNASTKDSR